MIETRDKLKVLLIPSSDYLGHPFPQRYNHIFEKLHGKEIEVHVIRFSLNKKTILKSKVIIHELDYEFKHPSLPFYYLTNLLGHNLGILKVVKKEKINCIVISNLSPFYFISLLKKILKLNICTIFDLQDYYPISAAGYMTKKGSIYHHFLETVFLNIMKTLIRSSETITVASRLLERFSYKIGAKRTYFIPNGVPDYFIRKQNDHREKLKEKLGLGDSIVLGYVGSIEFWLDFEPILKAMRKLIDNRISVKMVIIGGKLQTNYRDYLKLRIKQLDLEKNVIDLGFINHKELPSYIATFDFGLLPFDTKNPLNFFIEEPLKLWEYISQNVIPLSSSLLGILKYSNTFVYTYHTPQDIIKIVARYKINPNEFLSKVYQAKKFMLKYRTWSYIADNYKKIIYTSMIKK